MLILLVHIAITIISSFVALNGELSRLATSAFANISGSVDPNLFIEWIPRLSLQASDKVNGMLGDRSLGYYFAALPSVWDKESLFEPEKCQFQYIPPSKTQDTFFNTSEGQLLATYTLVAIASCLILAVFSVLTWRMTLTDNTTASHPFTASTRNILDTLDIMGFDESGFPYSYYTGYIVTRPAIHSPETPVPDPHVASYGNIGFVAVTNKVDTSSVNNFFPTLSNSVSAPVSRSGLDDIFSTQPVLDHFKSYNDLKTSFSSVLSLANINDNSTLANGDGATIATHPENSVMLSSKSSARQGELQGFVGHLLTRKRARTMDYMRFDDTFSPVAVSRSEASVNVSNFWSDRPLANLREEMGGRSSDSIANTPERVNIEDNASDDIDGKVDGKKENIFESSLDTQDFEELQSSSDTADTADVNAGIDTVDGSTATTDDSARLLSRNFEDSTPTSNHNMFTILPTLSLSSVQLSSPEFELHENWKIDDKVMNQTFTSELNMATTIFDNLDDIPPFLKSPKSGDKKYRYDKEGQEPQDNNAFIRGVGLGLMIERGLGEEWWDDSIEERIKVDSGVDDIGKHIVGVCDEHEALTSGFNGGEVQMPVQPRDEEETEGANLKKLSPECIVLGYGRQFDFIPSTPDSPPLDVYLYRSFEPSLQDQTFSSELNMAELISDEFSGIPPYPTSGWRFINVSLVPAYPVIQIYSAIYPYNLVAIYPSVSNPVYKSQDPSPHPTFAAELGQSVTQSSSFRSIVSAKLSNSTNLHECHPLERSSTKSITGSYCDNLCDIHDPVLNEQPDYPATISQNLRKSIVSSSFPLPDLARNILDLKPWYPNLQVYHYVYPYNLEGIYPPISLPKESIYMANQLPIRSSAEVQILRTVPLTRTLPKSLSSYNSIYYGYPYFNLYKAIYPYFDLYPSPVSLQLSKACLGKSTNKINFNDYLLSCQTHLPWIPIGLEKETVTVKDNDGGNSDSSSSCPSLNAVTPCDLVDVMQFDSQNLSNSRCLINPSLIPQTASVKVRYPDKEAIPADSMDSLSLSILPHSLDLIPEKHSVSEVGSKLVTISAPDTVSKNDIKKGKGVIAATASITKETHNPEFVQGSSRPTRHSLMTFSISEEFSLTPSDSINISKFSREPFDLKKVLDEERAEMFFSLFNGEVSEDEKRETLRNSIQVKVEATTGLIGAINLAKNAFKKWKRGYNPLVKHPKI